VTINNAISGVVVLYYPNDSLLDNISSYLNDIEKLYIIDNTPEKLQEEFLLFFQESPKILYINNAENLGIAKALNQGANLAYQENFQWLLTMDQDSRVNVEMLFHFQEFLNISGNLEIGILAPIYYDVYTKKKNKNKKYEELITTMTSGNLLNLKVYKCCGEFNESLFMDYVDHEYCLRVNKNGFKIIQVNDAFLYHNLGNLNSVKLFFFNNIFYSNHNPIRRYYITRNRLWVSWKYFKEFPFFFRQALWNIFRDFILILAFEEQKLSKIKSILLGIRHFLINRLGKLS